MELEICVKFEYNQKMHENLKFILGNVRNKNIEVQGISQDENEINLNKT